MKGFTKGKGKGKKFIPTSRNKSGLKKSDIDQLELLKKGRIEGVHDPQREDMIKSLEKRKKESLDKKCAECGRNAKAHEGTATSSTGGTGHSFKDSRSKKSLDEFEDEDHEKAEEIIDDKLIDLGQKLMDDLDISEDDAIKLLKGNVKSKESF